MIDNPTPFTAYLPQPLWNQNYTTMAISASFGQGHISVDALCALTSIATTVTSRCINP